MRKCKYYFMFFISLLICTGCESELSRKNMVYRDDRTETDFFRNSGVVGLHRPAAGRSDKNTESGFPGR